MDITNLKPNHVATLSVYYALFLKSDNRRSVNGLARWCFGLRKYVAGADIEVGPEKRAHLASQCLPQHFDDSGVPQPTVLHTGGQAIAAAPVTCELCGVGFAGYDCWAQHCRRKHVSVAEARKRIFFKARRAGPVPLLPWMKRSMVQGFQFFLYSLRCIDAQ